MDIAKRHKIAERLIFLYLVLFPFGQIIRIPVDFLGRKIALHPTDVIAFAVGTIVLLSKIKRPYISAYFSTFLLSSGFSLIYSLSFYGAEQIVLGLLYLIRLFSYLGLFLFSWNIVRINSQTKKTFFWSLIIASFFIGLYPVFL